MTGSDWIVVLATAVLLALPFVAVWVWVKSSTKRWQSLPADSDEARQAEARLWSARQMDQI